ncbi:prolyl oligopeptidase family serine peptidase [Roseiconus nitratireducens]|uniref:Prolyl oligopeptidase family serine peptidase n=1 Tax=Roseiconus nitratireducens TaxID=2605748 RepID=A0A5M6D2S7_9BACT|nr:acetylxylan esterase [Roseiconus nitratireducens]KAA5541771.1 prolyl oligopeptidase family serine peptidase [Roseiconus nitratireducens]
MSVDSAPPIVHHNRRQWMRQMAGQIAAGSALLAWPERSVLGASETEPLNRFPRMVHEFMVRQARQSARRHQRQLQQLKTKADAEQYVRQAQLRCRQSFGAEPERTPLNPRVTGTVQRDTYRIENVIFDSRPGFPVTANLYIPNGSGGPMPAVVGTCGHSTNGKAAEAYQSFAQGLARLGHVCLIYDPIGQGERLQYVDEDLASTVGIGVREHLHAGNQQFLVGEFFGMWRAWDGIRALDYLLTRPEVDPQRVGVTGNSGGGTMTTWLCGLESRWSVAAPSCFVTTFLRNLENELPQDTEQCPPDAFPLNLDHADFLAAMAPKPVIILAKEKDFFDVRGSEQTYQQLKRLYRLLDAEDNVALFIGPTGHGYSQENREAMFSWFQRAAGNSGGDSNGSFDGVLQASATVPFIAEPEIQIEDDATLWCTPTGQVASLPGTRTVFDFTREKSNRLSQARGQLRGESLKQAIKEVLALELEGRSVPDYRNWRYLGSRGYPKPHAMAYTVDTEPGVHAIVYRLTDEPWHSRPPRSGSKAILYVSHLSSDQELRDEPLIGQVLADNPAPLFTCDVRGIGESLPGTSQPGSFHSPYGSDYFYAIHSIMLGRPYVGQKTFDVLRVLRWLESLGHTDIHLVASGWGTLPATFAAVLSDRVVRVSLKHALTSYAEIAESEHYDWPLSTLVPDVLARFDLPDCYAELAAKQLTLQDPWGASGAS